MLNTIVMNKLELVRIRIEMLKTDFLGKVIAVVAYKRDKEIKAIRGHIMKNKDKFHTKIFSIYE